ncbi:YqhR family membrane protein [Pseudogracilibacillus sp. SO30301A]|uniref:YqhR family membrane protein n=1 Tax=Pseudogracilibacillus sp. SO30301A TaxID=3098291 RepID=UPI00300DEE65
MGKQSAKLNRLLLLRTILTGFFGGLFSGLFLLFLHYFNMTEVRPKILLRILFQNENWIEKWYANVVLIVLISIFSIVIALIYYVLLRHRKSWITGALFGVAIWVAIYFVMPIIIKNYNPFLYLNSESHVSMFCLFLLYGVFTGYSISFDYGHLKQEYE